MSEAPRIPVTKILGFKQFTVNRVNESRVEVEYAPGKFLVVDKNEPRPWTELRV